jgi:diguanylate cyclase (GGDEF)-like protein
MLGISAVAYFAAHLNELPQKMFRFAVDYANWEVDDLIFVAIVLSVAMIIYVIRRYHDVSVELRARRGAELEARNLARHDALTGLPNRRFFTEKLDEILRSAAIEYQYAAVLMLDLDGFKAINDVHGHSVGDQALVDFAGRMSSVVRPGTVISRVGGDEFAIAASIPSVEDAAGLARRIINIVAQPMAVAGTTVTLGIGIGIAVVACEGTDRQNVMRRADLALYRAKAEGRSVVRFFEPEMDRYMERRAHIERELRAAIVGGAVAPHYQPLVSLEGQRIIGFEALARWTSPALGPIAPDVFITIAEECGLISELGDQLLRIACREAARWPADLTLSFNISAIQLRDVTLGLRILAILSETGLNPHRLEVEITESAVVGDAELALRIIDELRAAGVRIALDDFGTGYATMSQLLSLRFDKLKIDKSFVNRLGTDSHSDVIVRAIIGLAKGLGLATTAEGIETWSQLAHLRQDGCLQGQGYLFGHAVPAAEIPALLDQIPPERIVA